MILTIICKKQYLNTLLFCKALLVIVSISYAQEGTTSTIDSLKKTLKHSANINENVKTYFTIADAFMDVDQYDSAQIWLNKIVEALPTKQASVSNYFLSSRQAEVYYYNGLLRLGLQESYRSLNIAKTLHDSLLLADAYNFIGLFYINLDSNETAVPNFRKGIDFLKEPPLTTQYLGLSEPHHLYGNLAEAFTNLRKYDTAIFYAKRSLQLAKQSNLNRGIAVAQNTIGDNYLKLKLIDSAIFYYNASIVAAEIGKDFDIEMLNYGGLSKAFQMTNNKELALKAVDNGLTIIKNYPIVSNLFTNQFYDDASFIYNSYNLLPQLASVLQQKNNLLQKQIKSNNGQMGIILDAGLQNETRVLSLQVAQATQQSNIAKTRSYYLAALIVIGLLAFVFYRYAIIQKLQKSRFRNKVSKDLHDDVGSSLSSLNVYSTVAAEVLESNPGKAKEMLQKISEQSVQLMENIGDIVWSMKSSKEETVNLSTKIKNFASDVLSAAEINYQINVDESDDVSVKSITARRNILMIIKEAINNAVKYSGASNITINIKKADATFIINITDNGKGFDVETKKETGNGLSNMQKRAAELNGSVAILSSQEKGTTITAFFPLAALNNVGW
jgi:signal transduction histidine kinase